MTENQRRKFLKLVGASLVGAAGVSILGCAPEKTQDVAEPFIIPDTINLPISDVVDDIPSIQTVNRKALAERLRQLAESDEPRTNSLYGTCYFTVRYVDVKEPCTDCDQIMIVGEKDKILSDYNVALSRIKDLGINATLIIPEHCPGCGLGLKEKKVVLMIKYPDESDFVRVELDEAYDLELMALFLQGKDRYYPPPAPWSPGLHEAPMKAKVDRLRKLFGVEE